MCARGVVWIGFEFRGKIVIVVEFVVRFVIVFVDAFMKVVPDSSQGLSCESSGVEGHAVSRVLGLFTFINQRPFRG